MRVLLCQQPPPKEDRAARQQEIAGPLFPDVCVWLYWLVICARWRGPRCLGALGPAGRGRRASGTACHEEGRLGMLPLLDMQRPWAGTESENSDSAQFIICGTPVPPPSPEKFQSRWAGWAGLHAEGGQLFRPQGQSAVCRPLSRVASAPRSSGGTESGSLGRLCKRLRLPRVPGVLFLRGACWAEVGSRPSTPWSGDWVGCQAGGGAACLQ